MDFGMLPPEINSARIYAGPGAGPMLAAAVAWNGLAAELDWAATSYGALVSGLTAGPWLGAASVAMAAAAAPFVGWMSTAAGQAAQAAVQAQAAAAAYEAAWAASVPPAVIAANRALMMALVATNFFGQNTAAIAATEAQYVQMWAQDAAAMYGYAGASATAAQLPPFSSPPSIASPGGLANQATAVAQATGVPAATDTQAVLSQLSSAVPAALQGLASPLQSTSAATLPTSGLSGILQSLGLTSLQSITGSPVGTGLSSTGLATASGAWGSAERASHEIIGTQGQITDTQELIHDTQGQLGSMQNRIMGRLNQLGTAGSAGTAGLGEPATISAGVGQATLVGGLSVPQGWAGAVPAIRPVAQVLPVASPIASPEVGEDGWGNPWAQLALASMAGRASMGGAAHQGHRTVMARPPSGG
jgi:PPE-repeat protein